MFFVPGGVHAGGEVGEGADGEDVGGGAVDVGEHLVVEGALADEAAEEGGEHLFARGGEGEVEEGGAGALFDGGAAAAEVGGAGGEGVVLQGGGGDLLAGGFDEFDPLGFGHVVVEFAAGPFEGAAVGGDGEDGEPLGFAVFSAGADGAGEGAVDALWGFDAHGEDVGGAAVVGELAGLHGVWRTAAEVSTKPPMTGAPAGMFHSLAISSVRGPTGSSAQWHSGRASSGILRVLQRRFVPLPRRDVPETEEDGLRGVDFPLACEEVAAEGGEWADAGVFEVGGVVGGDPGEGGGGDAAGVGEVASVLEEVGVAEFLDEGAGFGGGAAVLVGDDVGAGFEIFVGDGEGGGEGAEGDGVGVFGFGLFAGGEDGAEDCLRVEFGAIVVEEGLVGDAGAGEEAAAVVEGGFDGGGPDVEGEDAHGGMVGCFV